MLVRDSDHGGRDSDLDAGARFDLAPGSPDSVGIVAARLRGLVRDRSLAPAYSRTSVWLMASLTAQWYPAWIDQDARTKPVCCIHHGNGAPRRPVRRPASGTGRPLQFRCRQPSSLFNKHGRGPTAEARAARRDSWRPLCTVGRLWSVPAPRAPGRVSTTGCDVPDTVYPPAASVNGL